MTKKSGSFARLFRIAAALSAAMFAAGMAPAFGSDFSKPWLRNDRPLILDAYEYNEIDWQKLAAHKRIAGFINKASDGLPPAYRCKGDEAEVRLCRTLWKHYSVTKELYLTRRTMAKSLGYKWGAYHLARPGNPVQQADHFLEFAAPEADDLIALDIEGVSEEWMSLEDAEIFVRHIHKRLGRYPVLYANGITAKHIADHAYRYPLLSRLPLWYARYKPEIGMHFPKGNWQSYTLWQFSSNINCGRRNCPLRIDGTTRNIDINVAAMSREELVKAWPFGGLLPVTTTVSETVPLPVARLKAEVDKLSFVRVEDSGLLDLAQTFRAAGNRYQDGPPKAMVRPERRSAPVTPPELVKAYRMAGYRDLPGAAREKPEPVSHNTSKPAGHGQLAELYREAAYTRGLGLIELIDVPARTVGPVMP